MSDLSKQIAYLLSEAQRATIPALAAEYQPRLEPNDKPSALIQLAGLCLEAQRQRLLQGGHTLLIQIKGSSLIVTPMVARRAWVAEEDTSGHSHPPIGG